MPLKTRALIETPGADELPAGRRAGRPASWSISGRFFSGSVSLRNVDSINNPRIIHQRIRISGCAHVGSDRASTPDLEIEVDRCVYIKNEALRRRLQSGHGIASADFLGDLITATEQVFVPGHLSRLFLGSGQKMAFVPGPTASRANGWTEVFCPGWRHQPGQKDPLLSRLVAPSGIKSPTLLSWLATPTQTKG